MKQNLFANIRIGRMTHILRLIGDAIENRASRKALLAKILVRGANLWPLLISAAIAIVAFFWIHERPTEEFARLVTVKIQGVPENKRVSAEPSTVRVVFRGERNDLLGLDMTPPVAYVKYSQTANTRRWRRRWRLWGRHEDGDAQADNEVELSDKNIVQGVTRGFGTVSVVSIEPNTVRIVAEETASLSFGIDPPRLDGVPFLGYRAEVADYSPREVQVTGGSNRLKEWVERRLQLQLSPVSVDGRLDDFSAEATILPPKGDDAMDVSIPPIPVKVDVHITRQLDMFDIDGIPVRLSFPQGFAFHDTIEVEPASVRMTLKGAKAQISEIGPDDVAVYAELATNAIPAGIAIPVKLVSRTPRDKSIVEVNIEPSTVLLTALNNCAAPEAGASGDIADGQQPEADGRQPEADGNGATSDSDGARPAETAQPAETGAAAGNSPITLNDAAQQAATPSP